MISDHIRFIASAGTLLLHAAVIAGLLFYPRATTPPEEIQPVRIVLLEQDPAERPSSSSEHHQDRVTEQAEERPATQAARPVTSESPPASITESAPQTPAARTRPEPERAPAPAPIPVPAPTATKPRAATPSPAARPRPPARVAVPPVADRPGAARPAPDRPEVAQEPPPIRTTPVTPAPAVPPAQPATSAPAPPTQTMPRARDSASEPSPATAVATQAPAPTSEVDAGMAGHPGSGQAGEQADSAAASRDGLPARREPPRIDASWRGNVPPTYPPMARRMGDQGEVRLDVFIGTDGTVEEVQLRKSSGSPLLDRAAIDTVRQWRFEPALVDGAPMAEWYRNWRWVFRLEDRPH